LTTLEVVRYILSVVSVCQMITFESLDVGSSYLHIQCISRECASGFGMKVIGSQEQKKVNNHCSCIVKLPLVVTLVMQNREPGSLRVACGFQLWRIEWCDCHLCHV